MRVLPSGDTSLLVEVDGLDDVLALYAALLDETPSGVVDIVPASRTLLLVTDPSTTSLADVERAVRSARPRSDRRESGEVVEIPVHYDGEDLDEVASLLSCDQAEVVQRHTGEEWTVAFCGFAPGFGYLIGRDSWDVPRRASPRTKVPAGSVGLAGEFSGVYPRESPGGWQLIGRTEVAVFDLSREPPALLQPGGRVRFVDTSRS